MKLLLDIPDDKATFFLDVLKNFSFVKAKKIDEEKNLLKQEIKDAIEELNLIRSGKLKGIPAKELLDEL